jgi:hypothetical protein
VNLQGLLRARSLTEGESGKFFLQALPFREVFRFAKFTRKFEKLLRLLGFPGA